MFIEIPTYNSETDIWGFKSFATKIEYTEFVESQIKKVGAYALKGTQHWRQQSITFTDKGKYCKFSRETTDFIKYWEFEKLKSRKGVIIDDNFLTGHYYFYLNFCPIYNVVESSTTFPEIWDSQYDYTLHCELAKLKGKFPAVVKKRRWGYSYLETADLHRIFIFERDSICKIFHKEEETVTKDFRAVELYREFTNVHTGWYRPITGGYPAIQQRIEEVNLITKRKSYTGRLSILEGIITKVNPAKGVGFYLTKGFYDEAGTNNGIIKSLKYNEKAVKQGGIVKGTFSIGGSVGELKDCEDLKELMYNPEAYGCYGVQDEATGELRGLFVSEACNYIDEVKDDKGNVVDIKKYYDEDGNSDVEEATKAIIAKRIRAKKQSAVAYRLEISQGPLNLNECFNEREENIYPTHIIQPQYDKLFELKDSIGTAVELIKDGNKIKHKFIDRKKVQDWPIKPETVKEGCIMVYEWPIEDAPWNLYFAGVDPVGTKKTNSQTSSSLMSCYIIKGLHNINGDLTQKEIVAEYCGRYDDFEKTYEQVTLLWEWYKARPLIENNTEGYIQWLIANKRQKSIIKCSELSNLKEINPNYSSLADYGVTMSLKNKEYILDLGIEYFENPIKKVYDDDTGESSEILGVSRVRDYMLLKEGLGWTAKANTDRLVSFGLALWAVRIFNEMNHLQVNKLPVKIDNSVPIRRGMFSSNTKPMFNKKLKMF